MTLEADLNSHDPEIVHSALTAIGKQDRRDLTERVEPFLTHSVEFLREAAIKTLAFYWALPEHRTTALRLARLEPDPDEGVRAAAVMGLSRYRTDDESIRALLGIALDGAEDERVRDAAYVGLLVASGLPAAHLPRRHRLPGFEARADWPLLAAQVHVAFPSVGVPARLAELAKKPPSDG